MTFLSDHMYYHSSICNLAEKVSYYVLHHFEEILIKAHPSMGNDVDKNHS